MVAKRLIYKGIYHQRGSGIASILGSLFKTVVPALSSGLKGLIGSKSVRRVVRSAGKAALKTGLSAVQDAASGKNVMPGVKTNLNQAKKRIATAALSAHCPKKRPRRSTAKSTKQTRNNIFSYK